LQENFFFKRLHLNYFSKKYFMDFIYKEYKKGEILFKENDPVTFLYLIKSGEVSITLNKNLVNLDVLIDDLAKKIKYEYKQDEYTIKSDPFFIKENIQIKNILKLFIFGTTEVMGGEEHYFELNKRLYDAKVTSEVLKCYIIDIKVR